MDNYVHISLTAGSARLDGRAACNPGDATADIGDMNAGQGLRLGLGIVRAMGIGIQVGKIRIRIGGRERGRGSGRV